MFEREFWERFWRHPGHLIWVALAYFPFLGSMSVPLTGDQKVYLSTAMEMRQQDSWLKPILFGEGSYYKPPFQYWMTLLGWKVFGFNLWGALIPSVVALLLTCWFLGEIAALLRERRWFVNAGLWFAASLATITYATTAQMEIYVCLFFSACWWAGLKYLKPEFEDRNNSWLYLVFILAGVSGLVKSPLYSVFFVVGFLTYLILIGEWETFKNRHLYFAWALGTVVGSIWFILILKVDGIRFWNDYIIRENWDKRYGNRSSLISIWMALLYFCFPFTLMMIAALRSVWKGRRRLGKVTAFAISWAWAPALFFSVYPYRIKPYLYILVPLFSVLLDHGFFWSGRSKFFRFMMELSGVIMALLLVILALIIVRGNLAPTEIALGFVAVSVFSVMTSQKGSLRGFALTALAGVMLFRLAAISLGEWDLQGLRIAHAEFPNAKIAMVDENQNIWHEVGLVSVGIGTFVERLSSFADADSFLRKGGMVILTDDQAPRYEVKAPTLNLPWIRWKVRAKFPYKELLLKGRHGMSDFEGQATRRFVILKSG